MKVRGKKDNRKQGSNGGGVRHGADLLPQTHPKKKKKNTTICRMTGTEQLLHGDKRP